MPPFSTLQRFALLEKRSDQAVVVEPSQRPAIQGLPAIITEQPGSLPPGPPERPGGFFDGFGQWFKRTVLFRRDNVPVLCNNYRILYSNSVGDADIPTGANYTYPLAGLLTNPGSFLIAQTSSFIKAKLTMDYRGAVSGAAIGAAIVVLPPGIGTSGTIRLDGGGGNFTILLSLVTFPPAAASSPYFNGTVYKSFNEMLGLKIIEGSRIAVFGCSDGTATMGVTAEIVIADKAFEILKRTDGE